MRLDNIQYIERYYIYIYIFRYSCTHHEITQIYSIHKWNDSVLELWQWAHLLETQKHNHSQTSVFTMGLFWRTPGFLSLSMRFSPLIAGIHFSPAFVVGFYRVWTEHMEMGFGHTQPNYSHRVLWTTCTINKKTGMHGSTIAGNMTWTRPSCPHSELLYKLTCTKSIKY